MASRRMQHSTHGHHVILSTAACRKETVAIAIHTTMSPQEHFWITHLWFTRRGRQRTTSRSARRPEGNEQEQRAMQADLNTPQRTKESLDMVYHNGRYQGQMLHTMGGGSNSNEHVLVSLKHFFLKKPEETGGWKIPGEDALACSSIVWKPGETAGFCYGTWKLQSTTRKKLAERAPVMLGGYTQQVTTVRRSTGKNRLWWGMIKIHNKYNLLWRIIQGTCENYVPPWILFI